MKYPSSSANAKDLDEVDSKFVSLSNKKRKSSARKLKKTNSYSPFGRDNRDKSPEYGFKPLAVNVGIS